MWPARAVREPYTLEAEGLLAHVQRKPIRVLRMTLRSKDGSLRVSAPLKMADQAIRAFMVEHRGWIETQRRRQAEAAARAVPPPEYLDGEVLALWGAAVELRVRGQGTLAKAALDESGTLQLRVPPGATREKRERAVQRWYGRELLKAAGALLPSRQEVMGVRAELLKVRAMRSRWGSCRNARTGAITLSLELARRPPEALEYVLVHELAHLIVRSHGKRFKSILDRHLPDWRARRKRLNHGGR